MVYVYICIYIHTYRLFSLHLGSDIQRIICVYAYMYAYIHTYIQAIFSAPRAELQEKYMSIAAKLGRGNREWIDEIIS